MLMEDIIMKVYFLFDYERVEIIEVHFEDVFDDNWYKMMGYIDFNQDYTPCRDF